MADNDQTQPSEHKTGGVHFKGGPAKIAAVQQSAKDAQSKREEFAKQQEKSAADEASSKAEGSQ